MIVLNTQYVVHRTLHKNSAIAEMAVQCCRSRIVGYLSLTHRFSVLFENMTINHILLKSTLFALHLCRRNMGLTSTTLI